MRRRAITTACAAFVLGLAACGSGDGGNGGGEGGGATNSGDDGEYPQQALDNLMESCVAEEGATKEGCQCTLDEIKASMSYEEFKRVDTALAVDGDLDSVTPELRQKFVDSIAECRE